MSAPTDVTPITGQVPVLPEAPACSQCRTHDSRGCEHPLHGYLCARCAYRQAEHDDRADGIEW